MTLKNDKGQAEQAVRTDTTQKKKDVNLQELAEKVVKLLKQEARIERERLGPRQ